MSNNRKVYTVPTERLLMVKNQDPELYQKIVKVVNLSKGKFMSEHLIEMCAVPTTTAEDVYETVKKIIDEASLYIKDRNKRMFLRADEELEEHQKHIVYMSENVDEGTQLYLNRTLDPNKADLEFKNPFTYSFVDTYMYRVATKFGLLPKTSSLLGIHYQDKFNTMDWRRTQCMVATRHRLGVIEDEVYKDTLWCKSKTQNRDEGFAKAADNTGYSYGNEVLTLKNILCTYISLDEDAKKLLTDSEDKVWYWHKTGHWVTKGYRYNRVSDDAVQSWLKNTRECYVREVCLASRASKDEFKKIREEKTTSYYRHWHQCLSGYWCDFGTKHEHVGKYASELELQDVFSALEYMDVAILAKSKDLEPVAVRAMMKHICSSVRKFRADVKKGFPIEDVRQVIVDDLNQWSNTKANDCWHFAPCLDAKTVLPDLKDKAKTTLNVEELKKATVKAAMQDLGMFPVEDETEDTNQNESEE